MVVKQRTAAQLFDGVQKGFNSFYAESSNWQDAGL